MAFLRTLSFSRVIAVAAALVVGTVSTAKADIAIDDFSQPNPAQGYAIGPDANPLVLVHNLGGGITRTVTLSVTNPLPAGVNSLTGSVGGGLFAASFNVFSSGTATIAYSFAAPINFIPNVPGGGALGSLQFLGAGDSGFAPNIPLNITVATATGNLGFSGTLPLTVGFSNVDIPLGSLTGSGDLAAVNGVTINLTAGQAADLIFDALGVTTPPAPNNAIPAPAGVLLALAAIPVLGLRRKMLAKA